MKKKRREQTNELSRKSRFHLTLPFVAETSGDNRLVLARAKWRGERVFRHYYRYARLYTKKEKSILFSYFILHVTFNFLEGVVLLKIGYWSRLSVVKLGWGIDYFYVLGFQTEILRFSGRQIFSC